MGTRIVYDDKGKPQLVSCRFGEPNEEPPVRKVTPTAPSYLDSDLDTDSDSDVGHGSLLLEDDGIVDRRRDHRRIYQVTSVSCFYGRYTNFNFTLLYFTIVGCGY